ncbi:MAG: class I SAM-dependent rRNA methyltransferase [Proteobacteria bacterium]|nr:class I SAM-dependent rRNA methyltransferase [Pseudomonadota bacterium]
MQSSLIIDNGAARRVREGELWLPEAAVVGRRQRIPGIARLLDRRRRFVASAFVSPGSRHYLRVISAEDAAIDGAFWRTRFERALARRSRLFDFTDAYRVVFGESDGIPSVIVDRYADVVSFQIGCAGAESIRTDILEIVDWLLSPRAIVERGDSEVRRSEGLPAEDRIVKGSDACAVVKEGSESFEVDALSGQKTGAYLDYRSIRSAAREMARGDCLDAFCYQGWFSCRIAERARRVVAVDSSRPALDAAARNAKSNAHANIEFACQDAFDFVRGCRQSFDFIHLDPPAMAKRRQDLPAAIRRYERAALDSIAILRPGGVIMISACSQRITERMLEGVARSAAKASGRGCTILWRGIQDIDHPVLRSHPESLYLKAMAVRIA